MKPLRISALLIAASLCPAAGAAPFVSNEGYKFEPPADWASVTTSGVVDSMYVEQVTGDLPPSISVGVIHLPDNAAGSDALHKFKDGILDQEKTLKNFKLISDNLTTLANGPTYEVIATFPSAADGPVLKVHQFLVIHAKLGYIVTCTALESQFDASAPLFEQSIATFGYASSDGSPFTSPDGYIVTPPKDWTIKADADTNSVYFINPYSTDFTTNISIKAQTPSQPVTADDLSNGRADLIKSRSDGMTDVKVLKQSMSKVGGDNAFQIEIGFGAPNVKFRMWLHEVYVPHGGKLYTIAMMSKETDSAASTSTLASVLSTLTWTKPTNTPAAQPAAGAPDSTQAPGPAPTSAPAPAPAPAN